MYLDGIARSCEGSWVEVAPLVLQSCKSLPSIASEHGRLDMQPLDLHDLHMWGTTSEPQALINLLSLALNDILSAGSIHHEMRSFPVKNVLKVARNSYGTPTEPMEPNLPPEENIDRTEPMEPNLPPLKKMTEPNLWNLTSPPWRKNWPNRTYGT